jgi:acyl-CoA thioester hydrolase
LSAVRGHRVTVRWRDVDGLGHVNHAVVLTYFEEGRDAWLRGHGIARDEYIVGRCAVTFRREVRLETGTVALQCATTALGHKSVTTREVLTDEDGTVLAEGEFGLVLWDPVSRSTRPITDPERASLARSMEVPS